MTYKLVKSRNGDRWMKDGKFISANDVPEEVKLALVQTKKDEIKKEKVLSKVDKKCIVCSKPKEHARSVMGMTVALCDEHYFNVSYGAIAGLLNKKGILNGAH